jgi:hypothetical protein
MVDHIAQAECSISIFQKLEMARQLDIIAQRSSENILNTARRLTTEGKMSVSYSYLREIICMGWAIFRYPVLEQVMLGWSDAVRVVPHVAKYFNKKVEQNQPLPVNVTNAQRTRFEACCLRISIEFPATRLGDGDGLPSLNVTKIHHLLNADQSVLEDPNTYVCINYLYLKEILTVVNRSTYLYVFSHEIKPCD